MFHLVDVLIVLIFVLVQWRITLLLLRAAAKRLSGVRLRLARLAIYGFDVLLVAGYIISFSALLSELHLPPRISMVVSAFALLYLGMATGLSALHFVIRFALAQLNPRVDPSRRLALKTTGQVLMAAPFAAVAYGAFVERADFQVHEVEIPIPGLAADLDGVRILQLSDIHLSAFLSEGELARVIDTAREINPHLAVVTGDLISSRGDPLDACIRQLARLKSDAGIFGCMGNHERYSDCEEYTQQTAARFGIRFLRREAQVLRFGGAALNLAGVDYQPKSEGYLAGTERFVQPGAMNVLLSHNPDVFPVAANQGYNLLLAGHTHGGQVSVEILDQSINPARFFTPYVRGLYRNGNAAAYVTRGIGTIGIPARIGAPPEISVLRLRKA